MKFKRFVAMAIDYMIFWIPLVLGVVFLADQAEPGLMVLIVVAVVYASFLLKMGYVFEGSVGMKALGLKVVRVDGLKLDVGSYLLRWLVFQIMIALNLLGQTIQAFLILATSEARGVHELASKTKVVLVETNNDFSNQV